MDRDKSAPTGEPTREPGQVPSQVPRRGLLTTILPWFALAFVVGVSITVAATSPLLEWRGPVYIVAGFAGVLAMVALLLQPLLVGGYLPGLAGMRGRRIHRWVGGSLVAAVVIHVAGLWIFSPPDVIDALLLRSPTPFSIWGVIALWALFAAASLAVFRRRFLLKARIWRFAHSSLAMLVVSGSVIHALLIEGTMGTVSKTILCALAVAAMVWAVVDMKSWTLVTRGKR